MAQGAIHEIAIRRSATVRALPVLSRRGWLLVALAVGLSGAFVLRLALGSVQIPVSEVVRVLLGAEASKVTWQTIILDFRLPQALTAMLAGAALGVCGLLMQTLFRNPLADPFILGISSGASLGVALVVLMTGSVTTAFLAGFGLLGDLGLAAAASLGAGAVMLIVLMVTRRIASGITLLILGLLFSYMTSAVVSVLLYFSIPERIQAYINWTLGSFSSVTWDQLAILAPTIAAGLVVAFTMSKSLNALLLGEDYAWSMGIDIRRFRVAIIAASSLLAGTVTAFCGPIGFVGIAVPHLARGLFRTSDHRILIPATTLTGAIITLIASLIASLPGSNVVLPVNAVTAFVGAPVVIWVILKRQNMREEDRP
jgi:iron complex transport system permease protein